MDGKKTREIRRRLTTRYEQLLESINRNRIAAEQIKVEKTEDEGDLAMMSHDRELLYHLHESDFTRLKYIQEALKALDRGQYGDCVRCGEDINEKRLLAVPWAMLCLGCQELKEKDRALSDLVLAGLEEEEAHL